ncbi:uncharacterized protein EI90DRAFT_332156 [Cantharellus anzutake]|uniref:uncharacterized protein n=1 Tax=Cantharellus anzutake TaxID=1750568 RepID=UPI0019078DCA|nr:uncharacterized protein EI90DRAFT_332156 [Cantharellus anzutake]KAF8335457.1 hypothetical protein EI90DRAFT_332156 [Cantharellus anzutake]
MDHWYRHKRKRSFASESERPPKRQSSILPDSDHQKSSVPSSSFYHSQPRPANPQTSLTSDNGWRSGPHLVPRVAPILASSGPSHQAASHKSMIAPHGPSPNHPHPYALASSPQVLTRPQSLQAYDNSRPDRCNGPYLVSPGVAPTFGSSSDTSTSSPQVHPAGPQPPQISGLENIPHDYGSVESSLGVDGAAPAFGPSWPFPIPVLELPEISDSDSQSHALVSSLETYSTSSQTPCEGSHRDPWDGSTESYPEISRIVAPWSPSGGLQSLAPEMRTWRSNVNSISRSSTPVPGSSATTTPASPVHSDRLPSPSPMPSSSDTHGDTPNPWGPYDNNARIRTELENAGIDLPVPPVPEPTPSSSAGPSDGKKESIISATRLILQTASSALKFSPIPFLPNIPDSLLMLLQVYENVSNNNKALKGLNDDVQSAYSTMLRPLQLWTGPIPPEVVFLVKELHSTLEDQVKRIRLLQSQNRNLFRKVFTAGPLTQSINDVRMCISVALSRFAVRKIRIYAARLQLIERSV